MGTLARLGLLWLVLFLIMFPYAALFARGRAGARLGLVAGAVMGLATGLIVSGPDYEPRAASVVATIITTLASAGGVFGTVAALQRLGFARSRPHR